MPPRLPAPGPSFLKPLDYRLGDRAFACGVDRPRDMDGWWLALFWVAEGDEVAEFRDLGPRAGPPPGSPLLRLGPAFAGALGGYVLEEDGRQQFRLRLGQPPRDEARPWDVPAAVLVAVRFEPLRAATMRPTELADVVLAAFVRALDSLARP
ncbi:MAG TPA: hypothetical protein VF763_05170 [Candidatus Limnocylindrales bacterium]